MSNANGEPRDVRLMAILELVQANPKTWFSMGREAEAIAAVIALERRGTIEINSMRREFRLKPSKPR